MGPPVRKTTSLTSASEDLHPKPHSCPGLSDFTPMLSRKGHTKAFLSLLIVMHRWLPRAGEVKGLARKNLSEQAASSLALRSL